MIKENNLKFNVLKRMLGKKVVVILDHIKYTHYYGFVESIADEMHLMISGQNGLKKVNIFDIRSP